MNFEAYLVSKKIDSAAFRKAEAELWENWQKEFEQVHPNSFTAQKLYLINPLRRKYLLKEVAEILKVPLSTPTSAASEKPKPVMRPKPKIG